MVYREDCNWSSLLTSQLNNDSIDKPVAISDGGTGATTASSARSNLGLGSAATYAATTSVTSGSSALVTSGAVYDAIEAGGGGKGGTTINITTTTSSFYGRTITIAGDYATYTATFSSSGTAQVMVYYVDEYDIYIDSYHNPLNVTAMGLVYNTVLDSDYKTINISTTNTDLYGTMIDLKYNGVTRLSVTFNDEGTCSCRVGQTGEWAVYNGNTMTQYFTVTELDQGTQSVTYIGATVVSWSNGSIDDIKKMIQTCDNNGAKLSDYWTVGEERTINFTTTVCGSTSAVWVITDLNGTTSGGTSYNAVIHSKNILATSRNMNGSDTNVGGWNATYMRNTVMPEVYSGLESTFKSIIKQASNISGAGGGSDTIQTTSDYIWLFSEYEVHGSTTWAGGAEAAKCKQMEYFKTRSNRAKTGNTTGYGDCWWLRSPSINNTRFILYVSGSNVDDGTTASTNVGVVPAAII